MTVVKLESNLRIERCPYCNVDKPNLDMILDAETTNSEGGDRTIWRFYKCARCGGVVTAFGKREGDFVIGIIPKTQDVSNYVPPKAKSFLLQAIQSIHAPAGAIMLAASSVDAMLKEKGYIEDSLNSRIEKAAKDHLITDEMAKWAHQVRLDANIQRHANHEKELPTNDEAKKAIDFAKAFAEFLFVLPAMVEKGLKESKPKE